MSGYARCMLPTHATLCRCALRARRIPIHAWCGFSPERGACPRLNTMWALLRATAPGLGTDMPLSGVLLCLSCPCRKASGRPAGLSSVLCKRYGPLFIWGQLSGWYKQVGISPSGHAMAMPWLELKLDTALCGVAPSHAACVFSSPRLCVCTPMVVKLQQVHVHMRMPWMQCACRRCTTPPPR